MRACAVRRAVLSDSRVLAEIQVASYRGAYANILPAEYLNRFDVGEQAQDWQELLSRAEAPIVLVAQAQDGAVIGYAVARANGDREPRPGSADGPAAHDSELVALHVRQAWHRQGIGRQLVKSMAEALRARGARSMMLWVLAANPARGFYEHLGGQLAGRHEIELDDDGTRAVEVAYAWPHIGDLR